MKNILYVDDDENNLFSLKVNLMNHFKVHTTTNTDIDFISELLKNNNIDIIIMDEKMSFISGSSLIRDLKLRYPNKHYILTSGFLSDKVLKQLIDEKVIDVFFEKPWDINQIIIDISNIGIKYHRIVLIDTDILSNILNAKILRSTLKNTIIYDFNDITNAIDFIINNNVDVVILDDNLIDYYYYLKDVKDGIKVMILTDDLNKKETFDFEDGIITKPILKSNVKNICIVS